MKLRRKGWSRAATLAALALLPACAGGGAPTASLSRPAGGWDPPGPRNDPWGPWIDEAAARFSVPSVWIRAVMRQESGGRPGATSPVGAMGLMQLMPRTYAELRTRHGLGSNPYTPWDNIMAGAAYLRQMHDRFGAPLFLAAYNAGPTRVEEHLRSGRPLPRETRSYLASVSTGIARGGEFRVATAGARASAAPAPHRSIIAGIRLDPPRPLAAPPGWAVQVGAFPTAAQARASAGVARSAAGGALDGVPSWVGEVHAGGGGTLNRARLVGLTANRAADVCTRLSSRGMECVVVPPSGWGS